MPPPIRKTKFVPEWIDMKPKIPVPKIDWIKKKQLDIAYGQDPLQRYDLYYPENGGEGLLPVVVIVHGGGFTHMDKRDWHMYPGFYALREGFALVSVNYRLAPKARYQDELNDVIAAILHIKAHGAQWGLDPDRLFLYGTSAGGNLVAMAGLLGHNEAAPYAVRGVAALCPLISWSWLFDKNEKWGGFFLRRILMPYMCRAAMGKGPAKAQEQMKQASAENHIGNTIPPFYLQTGMKDPAIDYRHVKRFYELLAKTKNATKDNLVLDLLKDAPHAGAGPDFLEPESILPILAFFKRQF